MEEGKNRERLGKLIKRQGLAKTIATINLTPALCKGYDGDESQCAKSCRAERRYNPYAASNGQGSRVFGASAPFAYGTHARAEYFDFDDVLFAFFDRPRFY